jgi:hypothetical protein
MAINYTKCPKNRPNGHKIYQPLPLQTPKKLPKLGFLVWFFLYLYHLATLLSTKLFKVFHLFSKSAKLSWIVWREK